MKEVKEIYNKASEEIRSEIREKTAKYVLAGLGLVAGLAWNDAIKAAIDYFFPGEKGTIMAKFFYAAAVTLVLVLGGLVINRLFGKVKEKGAGEEEEEEGANEKKKEKTKRIKKTKKAKKK